MFLRSRMFLLPVVFLAVAAVPATVLAAGFEFGPQGVHAVGRGGAFVVGADDPSAIWWNPARLALMRGTRLMYNHTLSDMNLSFDRAPAQKYAVDGKGNVIIDAATGLPKAFVRADGTDEPPQTYPTSKQLMGWFPLGMSLGLTSDFGLKDWGFGIGLSGPSAYGTVAYANQANDGSADDPTLTSATRYSVVNMDALIAYLSVAAAYKYKEWFGIGATFQYVAVPSVKYTLDVVGPGKVKDQNDPSKNLADLQANVNVSDWVGFTGIVGAWVRPLPSLELALSARVSPIKVRATGTTDILRPPGIMGGSQTKLGSVSAKMSFDYPVDVKVGARYRHMKGDLEVFDIEADFVWEQWSAMDAFRTNFGGQSVSMSGSNVVLKDITMIRNLKDTYSVRLGGTYQAIPDHLWARLGGWWESGAQKNEYTIIDLPSWDRFGIGFGLSGAFRGVEIGLSYAHVFQLSREVKSGTGAIHQQVLDFDGNVKDGYAVNEGKYSSSVDVISLGITILWEELIYGKKPGQKNTSAVVSSL